MTLPALLRHLGCMLALLSLAPAASAQMDFSRCIDSLRSELPRHLDVRAETFATHTQQASDLRPPIDNASRNQPEFELPIWEYMARLVDDKRISDGRIILEQQAHTLRRIAARFGVDPATVVAVLGVESDFGRLQGRHKVVDATLSRACLRLSSRERKAHFFAALWLLQERLVDPDHFRGSWAGAFGMTQFMPGTFTRYMADGDGDGVIDTVNNMADALATTANYLQDLGWVAGLPWGIEVSVPDDVARLQSSAGLEHACLGKSQAAGRCRPLAGWAALGVKRADGSPLLDTNRVTALIGPATSAALLTPAGANGPAWLVTRNFQAFWQYNRADAYALALGQLASALRGEAPQMRPWPSAEAALVLSRTGLLALQTLLRESGQCGLTVDGYDGPQTRQAIRDGERRRGLPETGRPTTTLLELMRTESVEPVADCTSTAAPAQQRSVSQAEATSLVSQD